MEILKIESFIHSTEAVNQLRVNQVVEINAENDPKWQISITRKQKSSVSITRTKDNLPLNLTFINPGEYSVAIESLLSKKDKSMGQMPNIQKHQLTFKVL